VGGGRGEMSGGENEYVTPASFDVST
jgi:hypothetical protein